MINSPQDNIKLPEDIERAIEKSKNLITTNESEAKRLQNLSISLTYTIDQLHIEEKSLNEKILSLKDDIQKLEKEYNLLNESIENKKTELKNTDIKIKEKRDIFDNLNQKILIQEKDFISKNNDLIKKNNDIESRERTLKEQENIFNNKKKILNEALNLC